MEIAASRSAPLLLLRDRGSRLNLVLSPRGMVITIALFFLFLGPVSREMDIVASVLTFSLLAVMLIVATISAISGTLLRRKIKISLGPPGSSSEPHLPVIRSAEPLKYLLHLRGATIPPLFFLSLSLEFDESPSAPVIRHRVSGSAPGIRTLAASIAFPHRGIWNATRLRITLEDYFGLSRYSWQVSRDDFNSPCIVHPVTGYSATNLPVISSCNRPGDSYPAEQERQGDPYDLKQYHPSDGMRKILWKIYAKSGELIARHPEKSMTPEGQVLIIALASRGEDHVCSRVLDYLRMLNELNLQIFFGCEGMRSHSVVRTPAGAEELLIDSVWDTGELSSAGDESDITHFIERCQADLKDGTIERVLLFGSPERLANDETIAWYVQVGELLEKSRIKPIFCLTPKVGHRGQKTTKSGRHPKLKQLLRSLFVEQLPSIDQDYSEANYQGFLRTALARDWEVLV